MTPKFLRTCLVAVLIFIIVSFSLISFRQTLIWNNSVTFFNHILKLIGDVPRRADIYLRLGIVKGKQGETAEAIDNLQKTLKLIPGYPKTQGFLNLAIREHLEKGTVLINENRLTEALGHFEKVLIVKPDFAEAHYCLGRIHIKLNDMDGAVKSFEQAVSLKPQWAEPANDLAWLLAAKELNPQRAVRLAMRSCELTDYKNPQFLDTLAVAYASIGNFSQAVEIAEKALEFCTSPQQDSLRYEISRRLDLYKAGKPYVEIE